MNEQGTHTINVLSIIPYKVLPAQLGGEKGIALFNKYLGQKVNLLSVATRNNDPAEAENYTVLNILSNSRTRYINVFLYFTIRRLLRKHNATHLVIEHPYYGWLAWMIGKTMKVKWAVHSHNIEYVRSKSIGRSWWPLLKMYERWVYKSADILFFISEDDLKHAVQEMGVHQAKSTAITYGVEQSSIPPDLLTNRQLIQHKYNIADDEKIMLFNGALYHHTNYEALSAILDSINPVILKAATFKYKILVCGRGLPDSFNELENFADQNIIYAGFVDDISAYFKAADIFLNPIISGGGVKTKAIEALANNCTVVSTELGALGLQRNVCGNKLHVVPDLDWNGFAQTVLQTAAQNEQIPTAFYGFYYWGSIIDKLVKNLNNVHAQPH